MIILNKCRTIFLKFIYYQQNSKNNIIKCKIVIVVDVIFNGKIIHIYCLTLRRRDIPCDSIAKTVLHWTTISFRIYSRVTNISQHIKKNFICVVGYLFFIFHFPIIFFLYVIIVNDTALLVYLFDS